VPALWLRVIWQRWATVPAVQAPRHVGGAYKESRKLLGVCLRWGFLFQHCDWVYLAPNPDGPGFCISVLRALIVHVGSGSGFLIGILELGFEAKKHSSI